MKHISSRRVAAAASVALAASAAVALPSTAVADTVPGSPGITVGSTRIDLYGEPGDLDLTLTDPPATDGYFQLQLFGGGLDHLRVTDDAGETLPLDFSVGQSPLVTVGEADSDGNGIPGTPLKAGVTHLHVSAEGPMYNTIGVTATVIDGADGKTIAHSKLSGNGQIHVSEPSLAVGWTDADGKQVIYGPPAVPTGDPRPTTARLVTQNLASLAGNIRTKLTLDAADIAAAGYTAQQLAAHLHLSYSPDDLTYRAQTWSLDPDGSMSVQFPARPTTSGPSPEYLRVTTDWGLPAGSLPIHLQTLADDNRPYATALTTIVLSADTVPATLRAAFYGRDRDGVLWQYQATPDPTRPGQYTGRARVGGGWNAYAQITPLSSLTSAGAGDLVARDQAGVLWYYRGTGNHSIPFAPRTRVGGGWNTYTMLVGAGDATGDGRPDLLARDHDGVLWLYRGTGSTGAPFAARTRIGGGWNTYTQITGVGDMTGDGHPDLLAVDHDGKLWLYQGTGNSAAPYRPRVQAGTGWGVYDRVVGVGDMTGDGNPDLLARDAAGRLWYYRGTGNPAAPYAPRVQNGTGWSIYTSLF